MSINSPVSPSLRRSAIVASIALSGLCATPIRAEGILNRLYVELQAGGGWLYGNDVVIDDNGTALESDVDYDLGLLGGGAVGFDFDPNWRAELEYMYRSNDVDDFGGSEIDADSGDFASVAIMANAEYRFGAADHALRPYIGAGAGLIQEIDFDVEGGADAGEFSDRGGFAFQLMAGADYAVTANWSLGAELRYFDAGSVKLDGDAGRDLEADYRLTSLLLGVRYSF